MTVAVVRWWREEDLPRVAELSLSLQRMHAVALPERFLEPDLSASRKLFESQYVDPDSAGFVATVGSHVAGYLFAQCVRQDADGFTQRATALLVHHLVVMDEAQGAGIGTALMHSAIEHASSAGLATVSLQTWRFNEEARAFFEHLGFEVESMRLVVRRASLSHPCDSRPEAIHSRSGVGAGPLELLSPLVSLSDGSPDHRHGEPTETKHQEHTEQLCGWPKG